jgi:hypothetical protein
MENALKAVALAFGMVAASAAHAEEVLLSCWGTIEVIQQGKQVNPVDEKYSISVAVDIAKKAITIDGVTWPRREGPVAPLLAGRMLAEISLVSRKFDQTALSETPTHSTVSSTR